MRYTQRRDFAVPTTTGPQKLGPISRDRVAQITPIRNAAHAARPGLAVGILRVMCNGMCTAETVPRRHQRTNLQVSLTTTGAFSSLTFLSLSGETSGSKRPFISRPYHSNFCSEAFNVGSLSWELLTLVGTPTTTTETIWTTQESSRTAWKGEFAC